MNYNLDTNGHERIGENIETIYSAYNINNLMYGTTYYWRVRAKNSMVNIQIGVRNGISLLKGQFHYANL